MGRTKGARKRYDFHAHTFLSDGENSPTDMWSAAERVGHRVLALTDHVALEDPTPLLRRLAEEAGAYENGPMTTLIGVELSKVPASKIAEAARRARQAGAQIVIVHGETLMEYVPPGTNHAALAAPDVDLLAHPGLLTEKDADLAHAQGKVLELSARRMHGLTNGHVASLAVASGVDVVVDSDAHRFDELVPLELARRIAQGAGLQPDRVAAALEEAPRRLVKRCASS
ncbi:MAG: histidinol phosphate phosphatase domain-containing protein [Thermoplasmata archaeon]|nr:histidinol phosphate phosphatase domain-containing protein [Thermoplasmata archaeon]MCI4344743.1 histidinol phosphate phosphatase domain-containing protein [Thermoplasmata archaeon]